MSQILKLAHENQQLKRQINQYQQVLGVSPYVDDSLFKGGYRVVKTIADRDAIKCCWRKQGMKVVVIGNDLSFKEYVLKSSNCKENIWEEINLTVEENEVFLTEDYSELEENLTTQKELNLVLKQLILNLQTQIDNIELIDEKVQITETTNFAQIGQNQKDFNKNVSDYKTNSDLKNQEQDDRMSNIEGENVAQNDLINGLQADLDNKLDKGTYTGTAQDLKNEIDGKLNKPTITGNTTTYPFVVGEDGNGNSARLPAGDLGKNFFNSDLSNTTARNHTMNASVTVNTLGNPHTLSGLPNKNTDIANFRKVRVQNTSGLDAVVDSKNLLIDIPSQLSDEEKTSWKTQMNGGWTTATMSIAAILPIEISNYFNEITFVTIIGNNLNLNPATFSVEILDSNNNVVANVGANSDVSNSAQLVFWFNFYNFPTGSYKIRLFNGVAYITSTMTFEVTSRNTLRTAIDTSTLVWYDASNVSSNFRVDYQKGTTSASITITGVVNGRENTYAVLKSSPIINTADFSNFNLLIEGTGTYQVYDENIAPYANIAQIGIIKNASSITNTSDVINYGINSQGSGNSGMNTIGIGGFTGNISNKYASFKLYIIKTGNKLTYILVLGTYTSIVTEIISSDFTISALLKNSTFTSTRNGVNVFNITNISGFTY